MNFSKTLKKRPVEPGVVILERNYTSNLPFRTLPTDSKTQKNASSQPD